MQDDQLLQDLEPSSRYSPETVAALHEAGITTYSSAFALISDDSADAGLRAHAAWAMSWLRDMIDKRRVVPHLLDALQATDDNVRQAAIRTLGMLNSRRAVKPLIEFVSDRNQPLMVRVDSIIALCYIDDQKSSQFLRKVIFDHTEHVEVRSHSIEGMTTSDLKGAQDWIPLLSDPASDIRFWAAYRLGQGFGNILPALSELDRIVAFDHTLPKYWGWHVDREAILALENAYMQSWMGITDEDGDNGKNYYTWLISPAPEYTTFIAQYRKWAEDWTYYTTTPLPPVTLDIDPAWLADRLREQWPDVQLNAREPRPQAYLFDWRMMVEGKIVSGALHRDRYAVVVTGDDVYPFAAWYRSIIAPEQALYLYEWADPGVELRMGMTASDIEAAKRAEDEKYTLKT